MAEHTKTPWFKNSKFEVGPRPRTDDQHDGMLHPVADVFGDNREANAAFIVKAVNNHDAMVKALGGALSSFLLTQKGAKYSDDHWSVAAAQLLADVESAPESGR